MPPDRIVIYDLEYTSWEGARARDWSNPGEHREVVEVGAVRCLLHQGRYRPEDGFQALARPVFNPILSDYFITLTGITQDELDQEGRPFGAVLEDFLSFSGPDTELWSFGCDDAVLDETVRLQGLTWGAGRNRPVLRDIRAPLCDALSLPNHQIQSSGLPAAIGLPSEGRAHRALDDAMAVARVVETLDSPIFYEHLTGHGYLRDDKRILSP